MTRPGARPPCSRGPAAALAIRLSLGAALAMLYLGGCPRPPLQGPPGGVQPPTDARKTEAWAEEPSVTDPLEALRRMGSIEELWNAQNQAQDHLGQALARLGRPKMHRVTADPGAGPGSRPAPERPGPAAGATRPAEEDRSTRREEGDLCRAACRHVVAICYAARRICQIAGRMEDWAARQGCSRAMERCQEAKLAAGRSCPPCPGA